MNIDEKTITDLLTEIRDALTKPRLEDRLALSDDATAAALGISTRTLWARVSAGEFPPPFKLGGRVLWSVETIRQWLAEQAGLSVR